MRLWKRTTLNAADITNCNKSANAQDAAEKLAIIKTIINTNTVFTKL
jgi:hypothetical protein